MNFLKKYKRSFIATLTVLCLLVIFFTSAYKINPTFLENILSYVTTPIQSGLTKAGNWVESKISLLTNLSDIYAENERLKEENSLLVSENSRLRLVDAENEKLSALLNIDRKYSNYPKVGAEVSSRDPGNWYNTFIIDKGLNDGLAKNMVVIAPGGLVGRISEIWPNSARVVSLIDDLSSVSAKSSRSNDVGHVRGDTELMMDGKCRMEFNDFDVDIAVGDEIVTSQLSSIYPPGIIIGYVTEVRYDSKGLKVAIVKPSVDFSMIETVLVITQLFDKFE